MTAPDVDLAALGLDPRFPARLEAVIDRQLAAGLALGMQVYVSRRGTPVIDRSFGVRAQDSAAITPRTRFAVFSSSKPLTATALHLLADVGEVTYLDPVVRFLPEFAHGGKEAVTLRHLLLHQAGIADPADSLELASCSDFAEMVHRICRLEPEHPPGEGTSYHPLTGMAVLAEVVQRVSGQEFRSFCHDALFTPLGMDFTTFGLPRGVEDVTDTIGLTADRRAVADVWSSPATRAVLHPAIGGYSTARDLGRFYQFWLDALDHKAPMLTGATARTAVSLHAPASPTFGFGYGFMVGTDASVQLSRGSLCSPSTFGHPGMCSSQSYADPVTGLVVVLLANVDPGQAESDRRFAILCDTISRAVVA